MLTHTPCDTPVAQAALVGCLILLHADFCLIFVLWPRLFPPTSQSAARLLHLFPSCFLVYFKSLLNPLRDTFLWNTGFMELTDSLVSDCCFHFPANIVLSFVVSKKRFCSLLLCKTCRTYWSAYWSALWSPAALLCIPKYPWAKYWSPSCFLMCLRAFMNVCDIRTCQFSHTITLLEIWEMRRPG